MISNEAINGKETFLKFTVYKVFHVTCSSREPGISQRGLRVNEYGIQTKTGMIFQRLCSSLAQQTAFWKPSSTIKCEALSVLRLLLVEGVSLSAFYVTQSFMPTSYKANLVRVGLGSNRREKETNPCEQITSFLRTIFRIKATWDLPSPLEFDPRLAFQPHLSSAPSLYTPHLPLRGQEIC